MKLRPFELTLVATFAVLAVLAVTMLALYKPPADPNAQILTGNVLIWGTVSEDVMFAELSALAEVDPLFGRIKYEYIAPEKFNDEFVRSLADRTNPDLLLISHEEIVSQRDRLLPFSYDTFPLRDFKDRYIDGAEVFALSDGIYGVPIAIDPLVLYWNRSLLGNAGFLGAPTSWEQLVNDVLPALTVREFDRTITRATVAMGEAQNIQHFYPILSMLAIQSGSQLVTDGENGYQIRLDESAAGNRPFEQALTFFMRFSNPQTTDYTWNRALPLDRDAFVREQLALYFGFASEGKDLAFRNPNLNFDIAEVPKGAAVPLRRTYGRVYGLAVVRNATNQSGATGAISLLTQEAVATRLANALAMAPASRAGLAVGTSDVYGRVAYSAAPVARGWLMPGTSATTRVFGSMIGTAASDRNYINNAASDGLGRLKLEY